jgi:hypothetical protein
MQLARIAGHLPLKFFAEGLFFAENHQNQNPPEDFTRFLLCWCSRLGATFSSPVNSGGIFFNAPSWIVADGEKL